MKALAQILLYLAATVIIGALLAPPLYWIAHAAAPHVHSAIFNAFVAKTEFPRYFDRGVTIAALMLLWPLLRAFQIADFGFSLGLKRNRRAWRHLGSGLLAALIPLLILWGVLLLAGVSRFKNHADLGHLLWQVPLTAIVVSVLEEFLFRGALQGAVRKTTVDGFALVTVAILFAAVHFLKPPASHADMVCWWSGLAVLPEVFWMFKDPGLLLGGFTTLLVAGLILGFARMRTSSLWMPIGLHAGWIMGEKSMMSLLRHTAAWPWLGPDIPNTLVGLAPLIALALTWGIVGLMTRDADSWR